MDSHLNLKITGDDAGGKALRETRISLAKELALFWQENQSEMKDI